MHTPLTHTKNESTITLLLCRNRSRAESAKPKQYLRCHERDTLGANCACDSRRQTPMGRMSPRSPPRTNRPLGLQPGATQARTKAQVGSNSVRWAQAEQP